MYWDAPTCLHSKFSHEAIELLLQVLGLLRSKDVGQVLVLLGFLEKQRQ